MKNVRMRKSVKTKKRNKRDRRVEEGKGREREGIDILRRPLGGQMHNEGMREEKESKVSQQH